MVLDLVDALLQPHGLEVVMHETSGDQYRFGIGAKWRPIEECPKDTRKIIGWCVYGTGPAAGAEARACGRYVTSISTGPWEAHGCQQRVTHYRPWPDDAPPV